MPNEDIKTYLGSLPNKSNNDILGMDLVLLRESAPYIYISLANVINKSLGCIWAELKEYQSDVNL